tara:strand:- start:2081 stop:2218 length:138 start_codon:yes stop_codon:yes gene_type:complete
LELEELQLESLLEMTTPAPFLTTVMYPVGEGVMQANWAMEAHQTN